MEELAEVEALRAKDKEDEALQRVDQEISDAEKRLRNLTETKEALEGELGNLKDEMDALGEENDRLGAEYVEPDENDAHRGTFFDQLRYIEMMEATRNGRINGLKSVNNRLRSEIGKTEARFRRWTAEVADLERKLAAADADRSGRAGDLTRRLQVLDERDRELEMITKACLDIKATIEQKAEAMRGVTERDAVSLERQRRALEDELKNVNKRIKEQKDNEETTVKRGEVQQRLRHKDQMQNQTPQAWMSQRITLMAKVKHAREELDQINWREQGAAKSASRTNRAKEEVNYSEDEAKRAIVCEIRSLEKEKSTFIDTTMRVEESVKEELELKLHQLERTSQEIFEYQQQAAQLCSDQKCTAGKEQRINALRKELEGLRTSLSK